jgi:hypothetical protein
MRAQTDVKPTTHKVADGEYHESQATNTPVAFIRTEYARTGDRCVDSDSLGSVDGRGFRRLVEA